MAKTRRNFDREFKEQAARLAIESDSSTASVAEDLGVPVGNLRRWVREYRQQADTGSLLSKDDAAELARLRRENRKLKAERDILKKATALFAEDSKCNFDSSRNTGAYGQRVGFASCSVSLAQGSMTGCNASPAPAPS